MIPQYINNWLNIIETMSNQNTYKLAWGRSIIEYISLNEIENNCIEFNGNDYFEFKLIQASEIVLKYYWNQIFFFNLKQAHVKIKPVIIEEVDKLIELYKIKTGSDYPRWFQDGKDLLKDTKEYKMALKSIAQNLKANPCKYFLNANINGSNKKEEVKIYLIDNLNNRILIKKEDVLLLKEYGVIISKLLNFKWTQLLEKYNFVPMLSNKVTAISNGKIDRNNLKKYKEELIKEFKDGKIKDFYTGETLSYQDATVDHVIPWSFMYSDDIWNLVLTSKSNNSRKSNIVPSEEVINRLKDRNESIKDLVDESYKKDLVLAELNKYVDKYYYECKVSR